MKTEIISTENVTTFKKALEKNNKLCTFRMSFLNQYTYKLTLFLVSDYLKNCDQH